MVRSRFLAYAVVLAAVPAVLAGCAGKKDVLPPGTDQVDKFLFDKGSEALNKHKWYTAREFFSRVVDNYPQSPYRPDAKLGVGDTYLGEGTAESYVLAENEFKEFLTFYPTHERADYAQYKLGVVHVAQMRKPERDQSQTRAAVQELETFVEKYPHSKLLPEAREKLRTARDRLSTSDYQVGYFYYRNRWYPGAVGRFKEVLKDDPGYTNRDAVYYYLGESLLKVNRAAEALPYFDRLVKEFEASEFLEKARQRLAEFKPIAPAAAGAATTTQPPGSDPPGPPSPPATSAASGQPPQPANAPPPEVKPVPAPAPPPSPPRQP